MSQEKLSETQLRHVETALHEIIKMCNWNRTDKGWGYWDRVRCELRDMWDNHTTDGKPYVEPEPPIPDGYRLAVAGDEGRKACQVLAATGWINREPCRVGMPFLSAQKYIVPVDRIPTDEEAAVTPRIKVMVRNFTTDPWQKKTLFAVGSAKNEVLRFVTDGGSWIFCRHLYLGE